MQWCRRFFGNEVSRFPVSHIPSKRIFDVFFSLLTLILCSPIFILIGLAIFISSPGPIFFSSKRIGRGGNVINCWKFRSMYPDAEKKLKKILEANPEYQEQWEKHHKILNDPRIIPLGRFLRKTSLDELPQFFNVLTGDLSIVGPRAFAPESPPQLFHKEIRKFLGDRTEKVLSIRPGITGLWAVSGRSNLSLDERVELESLYVDNRSFIGDLFIMAKTIPVMIFSKGAY